MLVASLGKRGDIDSIAKLLDAARVWVSGMVQKSTSIVPRAYSEPSPSVGLR